MRAGEAGAHTPARMKSLLSVHVLAVFVLSALVVACSDADAQRRLAGTWLEESELDGLKIRRVLALKEGGIFQQAIKVVEPGGTTRTETTDGEWFFDGETFKRRYRTVNGKRVSGIQFATYQVISLTDSEIACVDHLTEGKRNIRFRRVADGTVP